MHGGPDSPGKKAGSRYVSHSDSDTDFQARGAESDGEDTDEDLVKDFAEADDEAVSQEAKLAPRRSPLNHEPKTDEISPTNSRGMYYSILLKEVN